jgi:hypothetical protein
MLHRTAKVTPFGRRLLVDRVLVEGWAPAIGISRVRSPFNDHDSEQGERRCWSVGGAKTFWPVSIRST